MKTRQERAALRLAQDRETGQAFADAYFGLDRRQCSAWEWFVVKSSGDERAARRRWNAADMDARLRDWVRAESARDVDRGEPPF